MAVPNTNSFSLQDVVDAVSGGQNGLAECLLEADSSSFDATYGSISDDDMLAFRNYDEGSDPSTLSLNPISYGAGSGSDAFNLSITTNEDWSYSDDSIWMAPTSSSGSGNANITIAISPNDTGVQRTGTITIVTTSGDNLSENCVVEQAG